MSNSSNTPKGATHIWTWGWKRTRGQGILCFYKLGILEWWVYSDVTGWRLSENDLEWFEKETDAGYFIPIEEWKDG